MKTAGIFTALVFSVFSLLAQDNIIFFDGYQENAKVLEVNTSEIKFRISEGEDPAIFVVPRNEVFMIQFEDGQSRVITPVERIPDDNVDNTNQSAENQTPEVSEEDLESSEQTFHQMGKRSPGLALALSSFVPGGGQYYNGDYAKGIIMSSLWVVGATTVFATLLSSSGVDYDSPATSCYIDQYGNQYCDDTYYTYSRFTRQQKIALGFGSGAALGSFLWSLIDAPIVAAVRNRKIDRKNNDGNAASHIILDISPTSAHGAGASFSLKF